MQNTVFDHTNFDSKFWNSFWQLKIDLGQEIFQISDLRQVSWSQKKFRFQFDSELVWSEFRDRSSLKQLLVKPRTGQILDRLTIQNLIKICPRLIKTVPSFTKSYFKYEHNLTRICFIPVPNSTEFLSLSKFDLDLSQISKLGKIPVPIIFLFHWT